MFALPDLFERTSRFTAGTTYGLGTKMTGTESRLLKVGDRVRWGDTITDCGTVIKTTWSDVIIDWDNCRWVFS
jgi:hypothetical protein